MFVTPEIVVEPVTARADVVAPTAVRFVMVPLVMAAVAATRLVKFPRVAKRLVDVALVVVELIKSALTKYEVEEAKIPCTAHRTVVVAEVVVP